MSRLPSLLPFALWNSTRDALKRGDHALCLVSIPSLDRYATAGPAPIGGIVFTGDPDRFTKLYNLIDSGVPLEPIHIFYEPGRPANEAERKILGLDEIPETIGFAQGRHRYALLRHNNWRSVFACVPKEQVEWFNRHLCSTDADCVLVANPAGD